nr:unnamed protein product [Spirometra erinaceieuropaei]
MVDIDAFSDNRFLVQGQLGEVGVGYTFRSGRHRAEPRDAGVAFTIRDDVVVRLPCLSPDTIDRWMSLRLSLRDPTSPPSSAPTLHQ